VLPGGHGDACGIGSAGQFVESSECVRTEFSSSGLRALSVFVVHAD